MSNGGNIEIRYDSNLHTNIFNEREETKNKIYENYVNNGIALNDKKKRIIRKYKINFNSISGNICDNQKGNERDKIMKEKKKYSTSFNYNFDTYFYDLKANKKIKNNYLSDRKNILIFKNFFNLNISKKIIVIMM